MAIAHVAAGTRTKVDVGISGATHAIALPAGHVSGHWLLLVIVTEDNTGPTSTPSGWSFLASYNPGASTNVPYVARPHVWLYHRIDNGSLGSTVSVTFSTASWPTGNPYVLAWTEAWSGVDTSGPVQVTSGSSTTSTTAAQNHPQITTVVNNQWLISLRAVGADAAKTFTISGGTNTERVDDSHGSPAAPSAALYDAGPLTAGLQTQRQTTSSATVEYGSVMVSIAIKEASTVTAVTAVAGTAMIGVTANDASVQAADGPWDLCADGGLPTYRFAIDWDADSSISETGAILNANPYFAEGITNWSATNATQVWDETTFPFPVLKMTTGAGSDPRSSAEQNPVVAGQFYRALGWLYAPTTLPNVAGVSINWFDSGHAYLSTTSNVTTITPGEWTRFDKTGEAPASAAYGAVHMVETGTPGAGYILYGYGIHLIDPSDTSDLLVPGPGEDTTPDIIGDLSVAYGRDQNRQLNPAAVGSASFSVINVDRNYSPEWITSPLFGDLEPARLMKGEATFGDEVFPIFSGRIDDYDLSADFTDRSVDFTFLDGLNDLQGVDLSTEVYTHMRTGELINVILDLVGWTAPRDIDVGATIVPFWWVETTNAYQAINDLVKSEGPPAIAYVAPDGTFVFRDRHHRILRSESITSQATYAQRRFDCGNVSGQDVLTGATATAVGTAATFDYLVATDADSLDITLGDTVKLYTSAGAEKESTIFTVVDKQSAFGFTNIFFTPNASIGTDTGDVMKVGNFDPEGFDFTAPFEYHHGWRDIVNSVTFEVTERSPDIRSGSELLDPVWSTDDQITLAIGQSQDLSISVSDPFMDAVTPVSGTDFITTGAGTVNVTLSRTSGQSTKITFLAVGGSVTISSIQLRARSIPVRRTVKVSRMDTGSISTHGERSYPEDAPWANANDADAIASMILVHYSRRRPTIQLRVVTQDPSHFMQILRRTISDRIHVAYSEIGLDADFFIERVTHTIRRFNQEGLPPVHSIVFGCEKDLVATSNPFRFDVRGAGFDDGVFDPIQVDNASTVFIFDHAIQGQFDTGLFGT